MKKMPLTIEGEPVTALVERAKAKRLIWWNEPLPVAVMFPADETRDGHPQNQAKNTNAPQE